MSTFAHAIRDALHEALAADPRVICYGLGVPDPKGIFGTTQGLQDTFGPERVFDMPTSENAMTGIAIGAALTGSRPVMTHQRLDFFLLAMDQLVNGAAKWHYTSAGRLQVPLTIRLLIGRGWGQGPTHSQSLQAWFTHIPGLKVVMPATTADAKGLLLAGIFDDNPVVFLEHRWLYNQPGDIPEGNERIPLGQAAVLREGTDVSLIGYSYMTVEALRAADHLAEHGVQAEVIDLRTLSPMDWESVFTSVRKTGRCLALDTSWATGSFAGEVVARTAMDCWADLKDAPRRIALPDVPVPAGYSLTRSFYPGAESIVRGVESMLNKDLSAEALAMPPDRHHDVPGDSFTTPF
ncbi:MAG: transketolase C-terminal domain-containing protein [Verrucomicrobiota bacterium]